jgi:Predicted membrane protein
MLRRLYDWCIDAAGKPHAAWIMGAVSFVESSFFPVPPDAMLIPMALARSRHGLARTPPCRTLASVAGGVLGYFIGAVLYDSIGLWLIQLYGYGDKVDAFRAAYAQWGGWIILLKGLTPIPYKIVTIASGFAGYNLFFVRGAVDRRARHAILRRGVPAQPLRPPGALDHRRTAGFLGHGRRGGADRGIVAALYLF